MSSRNYLAITGDVVRSRDLSEASMGGLRAALDRFNQRFIPVVPFSIQAGDEIQGLFALGSRPLESICWLVSELFPLTIRWGIGKGSIDSPLRNSTVDMRGLAFEYSRRALQSAVKKKRMIAYSSDGQDRDGINIILGLITGYIVDWNAMAFRRYRLYSVSRTIYAVAQAEGVSIAAVNKNMKRQNIRLVMEGIEFFDKIIGGKSTLWG